MRIHQDDSPSTSREYSVRSSKSSSDRLFGYSRVVAPWATKRYNLSIEGLHEEVLDVFHWLRPSPLEASVRLRVFEKVAAAIRERWKEYPVRVSVFGSLRTHLFLPTSDIDVLVECDEWKTSPLAETAKYLEQTGMAKSISVFGDAFVPIVKMIEKDTDVNIDVSFNTVQGVKAADYIEKVYPFVKREFPVVEPLVLLLKQFLIERRLNTTYTGGLSSYGLILMLINFLQVCCFTSIIFYRRYFAGNTISHSYLGVIVVTLFSWTNSSIKKHLVYHALIYFVVFFSEWGNYLYIMLNIDMALLVIKKRYMPDLFNMFLIVYINQNFFINNLSTKLFAGSRFVDVCLATLPAIKNALPASSLEERTPSPSENKTPPSTVSQHDNVNGCRIQTSRASSDSDVKYVKQSIRAFAVTVNGNRNSRQPPIKLSTVKTSRHVSRRNGQSKGNEETFMSGDGIGYCVKSQSNKVTSDAHRLNSDEGDSSERDSVSSSGEFLKVKNSRRARFNRK
uniref:NTP_transf_2 domain-containing protein n=1 Tax=Heterorhabditis bacteriophora TaxID=37862 RepID=A0A1I7X0K4_HETBA